MSISLLTHLSRETASINALLPYVLRRGTLRYPDMDSISRYLDNLYGAGIHPRVQKLGEIQAVGFYSSFVDEAYLPEGERILTDLVGLLSEMLLSPYTYGGLLSQEYVESEKKKQVELIESIKNEKIQYASIRAIENMCAYEDYSSGAYGTIEATESINYKKLTKHYKALIASSPIEIFYCGTASIDKIERIIKDALVLLPRGEVDLEIGTEIRMNALEEKPRVITESMDVNQGQLVLGFRLGEAMLEPDFAALDVFNAVYGGSLTSKLFLNVREKLSLAYFASSHYDMHKGILFANAGIEFEKYEEALNEMQLQMQKMREGEITDEELLASKNYLSSAYRRVMDSQPGLEGFYLSQNVEGIKYGPEELSALCELVTKKQLVEIARGVECDIIYFLRGLEQ